MQLSPLYLEKIRAAEEVGRQVGLQEGAAEERQNLILRILTKRVGSISPQVAARVKALSLLMFDELLDLALDFTQMSDLTTWLEDH